MAKETKRPQRLGDLLVHAGAITEEDLQQALEKQKKDPRRLGELLVGEGIITERNLAQALAVQLKTNVVSLSRFRPMSDALQQVPEDVAKRLNVLPMSILDDGRLSIAMSDPLDIFAIDELRMLTGRDIQVSVATASDVRRSLEHAYAVQESLQDAMFEVVQERGEGEAMEPLSSEDEPVIKLVNSILEQAVREGASDLHIEIQEETTRVRLRVDGTLFDAFDFPKNLSPAVLSRFKIMADMDITEKRKPQDGRILVRILQRHIDLRVSTLPTIYGEKLVIRILDQDNAIVGLENLGLTAEERSTLDDLINVPYGIILLTGPTGSGKSTTVYSLLERINKPEVNIITLEDPVEYTIRGVNQVQVDERIGRTFSNTLRYVLRQDPDKLMIGEIRDTETAQLAIRSALTGHLVLSTLHTNDAPSAVNRLVDMGVAPFLVSSTLSTIISQRLVRTLCSSCKKPYEPSAALSHSLGLPEGLTLYQPVGCDDCRGTGYRGRTGIYEIMIVNEEIRKGILDGAATSRLRELALQEGMVPLRQGGLRKVQEGLTSLEEVLHVTML